MKKILTVVALLTLVAGAAYADNLPADEDSKSIDELHKKLVRTRRQLDTLMKDVVAAYPSEGGIATGVFGQDVRIDVAETDKDIIVKADLPGMDKDKISVILERGKVLKISGERETVKSQTGPGMVRQERVTGKFERALELPAECKSEGIKATYKNGVLDITIPKKEKSKEEAVKIAVQ